MLSLRRLAVAAGLAGAGLVFVLLVVRRPADTQECDAYCSALIASHSRALAAQAVALDSARTALVKKSADFVQSATRYVKVRDSIFIPVTHADTVHILDRLPSFLTAADSMHHACTELAESCAVFRVRAESSLAGLTVDRDAWKALAVQRQPSRWDGVKTWAIRGLIAYGAFRLGQAAR